MTCKEKLSELVCSVLRTEGEILLLSLRRTERGWSQVLLRCTQEKDKRQQAKAANVENFNKVSIKRKKSL